MLSKQEPKIIITMMRRRTVTYRLFGAPPGSQARAESFQPRPRSPRLNRFKVERWASVVSDSEHCSPQLPWQLGKIRKPGGRETALSLGRQFTCSKWGPCLATYRSDPKRPRVGCCLSRNWGEGWLGGDGQPAMRRWGQGQGGAVPAEEDGTPTPQFCPHHQVSWWD